MVRGVATIAQGYQVGSVIDATGGTGYQMMDISLARGARVAASPAGARVSCENYGSDRVPITGLHLNTWNEENIPRRDSSRQGSGSMQNEARQTDCRTSDRSLLWRIEREEASAPRKTRWLANGSRVSCGAQGDSSQMEFYLDRHAPPAFTRLLGAGSCVQAFHRR